ncbi:MAG: hypothetical protein HOW73_21390 [Polyangiaceae bacterium]|nr:hypothetical protein [Polyangiaceae bacterium]
MRTTVTNTQSPDSDLTLSRRTLESTPQRAVAFLRAVATSLPIRAALAEHGYTIRDHEEGMNLLLACTDVGGELAEGFDLDRRAHRAIAELDAWDDSGYLKLRAALQHRFPAEAELLLRGLGPETDLKAVAGVRTLLARFDELAADAASEGASDDAAAALAFLEKKGFGKAERDRLSSLVMLVDEALAQDPGGPVRDPASADLERLRSLRSWYERWSELARKVVAPAFAARIG